MRVVIHTPVIQVAEYELDALSDCSDKHLLEAAESADPIKAADLITAGEPYVYARGPDSLAQQGKQLQQAEERLSREKATARELARRAFRAGVSKRLISSQLGIARPTLDAWLETGDR